MILASLVNAFLMCLLIFANTALSGASEGDAFPAQCSRAKGRMRRALGHEYPHVRKRRTIEVPKGTQWEMKWALNLPFETQRRHLSKLQITIPVNIKIPAFMYDDHGLEKLLGFYKEKGTDKAKARIDDIAYDPRFDETAFGTLIGKSQTDSGQGQPISYPNPVYLEQDPTQMAYRQRVVRSAAYSKAIQSERMELYYVAEGLFNKLGVPGPACMQRTICEVAQQPFEEGVVGDFINLFLTPSMSTLPQEIEDYGILEDYVKAEQHGEEGGHCGNRYEDCPASMFELLPVVVNTIFGH